MSVTSYIFGRKYGANFLEGLVAYYPLNSNANDSINSYNGTLIGSPTFVAGKVDNAINFGNDATLRYVNIPDNNDFSFTNGVTDLPFTISMWVNFSGLSSSGNVFIDKATSSLFEWQFARNTSNAQIFFSLFSGGSGSVFKNSIASFTPLLNEWYHLTATYNGTDYPKLYVDGISQTTIEQLGGVYAGMNNTSANVFVGQRQRVLNDSVKHKGLIDELAIWKNRELTASEVLELYNKGNSGLPLI